MERGKPEWKQWGFYLSGTLAWIGFLVFWTGAGRTLAPTPEDTTEILGIPSIFGFTLLGWLATLPNPRTASPFVLPSGWLLLSLAPCLRLWNAFDTYPSPLILEETESLQSVIGYLAITSPLVFFSKNRLLRYTVAALLLLYPLTGILNHGWRPGLTYSVLTLVVVYTGQFLQGKSTQKTRIPIGWIGIILGYLALKWSCFHYSATDENIYFYQAAAWAEGVLPYRDFFFAHPPLHIAPPAPDPEI